MPNNLIQQFQKPVFLDHDGSLDDYIALITLLSLDKYCLTGISVCGGEPGKNTAIDLTLGILDFFCRYDVEVVKSCHEKLNLLIESRDRKETLLDATEILPKKKLNGFKLSQDEPADFMAKKILEQEEKTIVVLNSTAMNFSNMLLKFPEITNKIEKVLWVAGAFLADGNVIAPDHDGSAEWNVYIDPEAASKLLESAVPVMLFPLDTGTMLPVDNYFMYHLSKNSDKKLSELVHRFIEADFKNHQPLYLNSLLSAVYLAIPEIFELETKSIKIEQRGTSMGNIYRTSLGHRIKNVTRVDEDEYYEFLIKQFRQF